MKFEREQIENLVNKNPELKTLHKEHLRLEKLLEKYNLYSSHSILASQQTQALKKQKLACRDKMMELARVIQ